jgi:hypothetical protein
MRAVPIGGYAVPFVNHEGNGTIPFRRPELGSDRSHFGNVRATVAHDGNQANTAFH